MPLVAATAVAAGAALQSATGFGFSLIAAPIVFAVVGPPEAVGLLLILGLEVNLMTLFGERRRPDPLTREALVLVLCAVPGSLAGVAVLRALDPLALQIALSVGVVATLLARRLVAGHHVPGWAAPVAGFTSGALSTSTSTSGPPLLVYLLGRDLPPARVRDTLTVVFVALGVMGGLALWVTGTDAAPDADLLLLMMPLVAVAHVAGRPLFARLARGGRYEPVVTGVLLVSVVAGLAGAVT